MQKGCFLKFLWYYSNNKLLRCYYCHYYKKRNNHTYGHLHTNLWFYYCLQQ